MTACDPQLFAHLETFLTEPRQARLREVLARRTRHVALVLDDVYQPYNMSAALRSCDAFGVQDVYLVESRHQAQISSDVAGGSDKWLTRRDYIGPDAAERCIADLRRGGYRIVATSPRRQADTPETLPLDQRVAVVIGNETSGVSTAIESAADGWLRLPMEGFVESFNLSVSAALCLSELTRRLRRSAIDWRLSAAEAETLLVAWTRASIAHVDAIEARWRAAQADAP